MPKTYRITVNGQTKEWPFAVINGHQVRILFEIERDQQLYESRPDTDGFIRDDTELTLTRRTLGLTAEPAATSG